MVIGVSGGLDSTHALIVAAKVCDRLGLPRTTIRGYTMPGFGTSEGTKSNAWKLMQALGITAEEIDIRPTAMTMLENIGHPFARGEPVHDVTFENVQAGLRTDYLFRLAGRHDGFVIGTGDLSEVALGWSTYGVGDQMSHYNVNAGVPKTLIQYLIRWTTRTDQFDRATDAVLEAILAQEISPELVPVGEDGEVQSTEQKIGPYELNDFFLHHMMRYGQRPSKVAFLAWHAWRDKARGAWPAGFAEAGRNEYDLATIRRWLESFLAALLRLQPVQAQRDPQRAQGLDRRRAQPARRLARAERRLGGGVAGRAARERARIGTRGSARRCCLEPTFVGRFRMRIVMAAVLAAGLALTGCSQETQRQRARKPRNRRPRMPQATPSKCSAKARRLPDKAADKIDDKLDSSTIRSTSAATGRPTASTTTTTTTTKTD